MVIAAAAPEHFAWIIQAMRTRHRDAGMEWVGAFDDESTRGSLGAHTLVALEQDKPVGFISGNVVPYFKNHAISIMSTVAWFVDPLHRGTGIGRALMGALENTARTNGATVMTMDAPAGQYGGSAAFALCNKTGFEMVGTTWARRVEPCR